MEENKKRSYKKLGIACLLSAGVMMATFGGTWAYFNESLSLDNPLKTSNTSVAMVEDYNPNQSFLPGETAVKRVFFENSGDMDLLLRVEVPPEEGWYDIQEGTVSDKKNDALDTKFVIKNWTDSWTGKDVTDEREDLVPTGTPQQVPSQDMKKWSATEDWTGVIEDNNGKSYRYYKKILYAKDNKDTEEIVENQTADILSSITLSTDADVTNDRHQNSYGDKIYKLTFNAEAVPVEDTQQTAAMNEWGMTAEVSADGTVNWTQGSAAGN